MASNTNDLFNSHEMEEGGFKLLTQLLVYEMFWVWCEHTSIIQDFDELYIAGIWWVGFSSGPYIRAHARFTCELLCLYFMFSVLIF
jgi:hypothetical protein